MGFWETLEKIDKRHLYVISIIAVLLPVLFPSVFFTPVTPTYLTNNFIAEMVKFEPGDIVTVHVELTALHYAELGSTIQRILVEMVKVEKVKLIFVTFISGHASVVLLSEIDWFPALEKAGAVYGEDYMSYGLIPGGFPAAAAWGYNPRGVSSLDQFGNPIADLPLIKPLYDEMDATGTFFMRLPSIKAMLILGIGSIYVMSTIAIPHSMFIPPKRILAISTAMMAMYDMAWITAGLMKGMIAGARGGAEFEVAYGETGPASAMTSALSLSHTVFVAFIIIGNAIFLRKRLKGGT